VADFAADLATGEAVCFGEGEAAGLAAGEASGLDDGEAEGVAAAGLEGLAESLLLQAMLPNAKIPDRAIRVPVRGDNLNIDQLFISLGEAGETLVPCSRLSPACIRMAR
jgi:hypothetical protein